MHCYRSKLGGINRACSSLKRASRRDCRVLAMPKSLVVPASFGSGIPTVPSQSAL